jgi:DNA-binding HxlR family transcriptional regulator
MRGMAPTGKGEEKGNVCEHFQRAAEILGRRWNPQVIRVLLFGPARFGEIRERVPGISDNLLSERLKQLEAEGIVTRTVHGGRPVLIEYGLTESGLGLGKAIDALAEWAERFATGKTPAGVR